MLSKYFELVAMKNCSIYSVLIGWTIESVVERISLSIWDSTLAESQENFMSLEQIISQKLTVAFKPLELLVENESDHHQGHAGDDGSGESHWRITITAQAFTGKSRVERQRMINEVLASELASEIHALAMSVKGAGE
jgi:BolA protein